MVVSSCVHDRVVLARLTAEDAPEVVEAPGVRPPIERARGTLDVVRCQVPFAESGGRIAIARRAADEGAQSFGRPRIIRGTDQASSPIDPNPTAW